MQALQWRGQGAHAQLDSQQGLEEVPGMQGQKEIVVLI